MPSKAGSSSAHPQHRRGVIYSKTPPLPTHPPSSFPQPPLRLIPSFSRLIPLLLVTEHGFHFGECLLLLPEMAELKA